MSDQNTDAELDDKKIVRALEEDIIFGRLAPGARLTEDSLLSRFPVTRHFVRQALVQLEQMGVVVRERNKGATVRSLTPDEVQQIYAVRELVQRQAALLIPLPAPQSLVDELLAIHKDHGEHIESGYLRGVHETIPSHAIWCLRKQVPGANHRALHALQPAGARQFHGRQGSARHFAQPASADDRDVGGAGQLGSGPTVRGPPAALQAALYRSGRALGRKRAAPREGGAARSGLIVDAEQRDTLSWETGGKGGSA
jgi:DNA-binding transcriptional regulator YhcF (GntR family)